METIGAGEEDFGKRQIGLWIDKLQTPHGDDYQEATSATEYHGWDSSVKYREEFDAFVAQMKQSFKQKARAGASAQLEKPRPRYLKDPDRMKTCKPSEALKSRLVEVMEAIVAGEGDLGKREIGLVMDKLQTPHGSRG
jgi:hypothetical protein